MHREKNIILIFARVLIETIQFELSNHIIQIKIYDKLFRIGIVEEPFSSPIFDFEREEVLWRVDDSDLDTSLCPDSLQSLVIGIIWIPKFWKIL